MNPQISPDSAFLSLGLDIGTTTTHLVLSRLVIGAGEDPFGRAHLLDREIVHRSDIYMTPMGPDGLIDADRIHAIVAGEYARAGVTPADVLTGAVIVTGETALKRNADQVVQRLAGESSSFAAAVAGANQESILAGRGSGAAEHSRRHHCPVLNVDIGGGTTNLAWFEGGQAVAAAAVRVGGRHLVSAGRDDATAGDCNVISSTARHVLATDRADAEATSRWIEACIHCCRSAIAGDFDSFDPVFLVTRPAVTPPCPDVIFFSGGVANLMAALDRGERPAERYGDTGFLLATGLLAEPGLHARAVQYPAEPIRATVIGAGQFSASLSGETLWADPALLPLRNLPVLRPARLLSELPDAGMIASGIQAARHLHAVAADHVVSIALPSLREADWDAVVRLARDLAQAAADIGLAEPWVFTMRDNFGRLLGQTIAAAAPHRALIVIDEIETGSADYLDIGRPVTRPATVIPVVAKSLIFERGG
jgi:ethanolamine utilization protein EutA